MPQQPVAIINRESLEALESSYRKCIETDPENTEARSGLAWCLFMQAVHQSGQESLLSTLCGEEAALRDAIGSRVCSQSDRDARQMLRDCLHQAVAVAQLSPDRAQRSDVGKLRGLIRLSGGTQALLEAEQEAEKILSAISRDLLISPALEADKRSLSAGRRTARRASHRRS